MTDQMKPAKAMKKGITRKYDDSANKSNYSSKSLPYDKRNITNNSQSQVTKFRKAYKDVSPDAQIIVDQILDPAMQNNPSLLPTYGVGCLYTANNIIGAKFDINGESIVLTYPSLRESIFYTSGTNVVTSVSSESGAHVPYLKQMCAFRRNTTIMTMVTPFYIEGNRAILSKPSLQASSFIHAMRPAITPSNDIVARITVADSHTTSNLTFIVKHYDSSENFLSQNAQDLSNGTTTVTLFGVTAGIEWVSFHLVPKNPSLPYDSDVIIQLFNGTGGGNNQISLPNKYTSCFIQNINEADTIVNSAESYFISSMSTLITYEGSSIKENGRLSICRLPAASWVGQAGGQNPVPTANSYYQYCSSLSRNTYNGPSKNGGFCFYLGEDEQNYFYRSIEEVHSPEMPYVVAAFSTDPLDPQDFRIQITSIVQFTTNSNIYNQVPSPYLGEDWCKILHILSCINAAYDNAGHRDKLKAALKKVGIKVLGLLKDPKTYATVGSIIAGLL